MSTPGAGARVLIMAAGTGGHVYPALAVALRLRDEGVVVEWLGTANGLEQRVVPAAGFVLHAVAAQGLRGKTLAQRFDALLMMLRACYQSLRLLRKLRPRLVFGLGGYVSGPGGLAARLLGVPLCIHEQNALPGLTNRILARWLATCVFEAFPGSFPASANAVHTGNPVRKSIAALAPPQDRLRGRVGPLHLLVLGGSQGAQALNEQVPKAIAVLADAALVKVRHQAGAAKLQATRSHYAATRSQVDAVAYIEDMAAAYAWSDLVICRAGATTVAELAAVGVAAILIPYPYAVDDHQTVNARYLSDAGAAVLIDEHELRPPTLAGLIEEFHKARERLMEMALAARRLGVSDACERVVAGCMGAMRA